MEKMTAVERLKERIKEESIVDIKFCLTSVEDKSNVSVESTAEEVLQILNARREKTTREYTDF